MHGICERNDEFRTAGAADPQLLINVESLYTYTACMREGVKNVNALAYFILGLLIAWLTQEFKRMSVIIH
jgi:hypothetical protein